MSPSPSSRRRSTPVRSAAAVAALLLGGCATSAVDRNFEFARGFAQQQLGSELAWLRSDESRQAAQAEVERLLGAPLAVEDAVRIALAYSPALQALLHDKAASSAAATQSARLPNPVFTFERLVRNQAGERDLDIGRMLGFPLGSLLLLPTRLRLAEYQQQQAQLQLAGDAAAAAIGARQAWVAAVAARQLVRYAEQVKASADASAELARRMQAVGNFSKLQRARQQSFAASAVAQLARAQQASRAANEALVRSLGLGPAQARALQLPDRLPELPKAPRDEQTVAQAGIDQRLDLRIARAELEFAARSQGLTRVAGFVDGFHVAGVRNSETGRTPQKGYELELPLPIFDLGNAARAEGQARYLAALQRTAQLGVEAGSQLRERYGAWRTAYDIALHYRDEVVPLQRSIAEENLLRYNGMLIGVFELLADARDQVASVVQAIEAERDFWLADAALQAAVIGRPGAAAASTSSSATAATPAGGH